MLSPSHHRFHKHALQSELIFAKLLSLRNKSKSINVNPHCVFLFQGPPGPVGGRGPPGDLLDIIKYNIINLIKFL